MDFSKNPPFNKILMIMFRNIIKITPTGIRFVDPPGTYPKPQSYLALPRPTEDDSSDSKGDKENGKSQPSK